MCMELTVRVVFFFFKQKTAYEMRISDWSSDVCSSDLKMTVTQAQHLPKSRRAMPLRASMVGLVAGLVSAFGAVHAQQPAPAASYFAVAQSAAPVAVDPAKQVAGGLAVSSIDFKRGDGGSGKLIMRFSGDGAVPDMRKDRKSTRLNSSH